MKILIRIGLLVGMFIGLGCLQALLDRGLAHATGPAEATIVDSTPTQHRIDPDKIQKQFRSLQAEYRRKQASQYDLTEVNPLLRQLVEARDKKDWNKFVKILDEIAQALASATQTTESITLGSPGHASQLRKEPVTHSPYSFGIFNAHVYDGTRFNDDLAVELGIQVTRVQLLWSDFQQSEGEFRFGYPDHLIGVHNDAKIIPVVTLLCSSPWATRAKRAKMKFRSSPPKNISQYEQFITKVVNRYKHKVKYWQIDNEVYYPFFWDGTKEDYLELLKCAYAAIKRVDPGAKVVLAGFPDEMFFRIRDGHRASREFFEYFMDKGRNYFDVIDFHQYFEPEDVYVQVELLREAMRKYGYQKELICTEAGGLDIRLFGKHLLNSNKPIPVIRQFLLIPKIRRTLTRLNKDKFTEKEDIEFAAFLKTNSDSRPILERYQAEDLVKRVSLTLSLGVSQIHWVNMKDAEKKISVDWFHAIMGLVDTSGRKKPHYYTYKLLIDKTEGFVSVDELRRSPTIIKFSFPENAPIYVVWNDGASTADLTEYFSTSEVVVTHIITEQGQTEKDARLEIMPAKAVRITETPIFIDEKR